MATTKINQQQANDYVFNNSMARQAIINGNFDVWQRGVSFTPADAAQVWGADHWADWIDDNGGTLPTLSRTREALTAGDLSNSYYYSRLTTNGAGTSLGNTSYHLYRQPIENGVRNLCGNGKKVTVSFYARSSIANKKLGLFLRQNYGSGGSPTSPEYINGTNWTLTSTWTKYTHTFTTNTLVSKTFGTANDDMLEIMLGYIWGTTTWDTFFGDTNAETYVGSGNIDIAQVQLCAGDAALPFMPKSYEEELRACMRYYQQFGGIAYTPLGAGKCDSTTVAQISIPLLGKMRASPTIAYTGTFQITVAAGSLTDVTLADNQKYDSGILVTATAGSGLTAGHATNLFTKNSTTSNIGVSAEL